MKYISKVRPLYQNRAESWSGGTLEKTPKGWFENHKRDQQFQEVMRDLETVSKSIPNVKDRDWLRENGVDVAVNPKWGITLRRWMLSHATTLTYKDGGQEASLGSQKGLVLEKWDTVAWRWELPLQNGVATIYRQEFDIRDAAGNPAWTLVVSRSVRNDGAVPKQL